MKKIIALTILVTLVMYIPYRYFTESPALPPLEPIDTGSEASSDDKLSLKNPFERVKPGRSKIENLSLEELITLHQSASDPELSRAAFAAIGALKTREAQKYLVDAGSTRPGPEKEAIPEVPEHKYTEFFSP